MSVHLLLQPEFTKVVGRQSLDHSSTSFVSTTPIAPLAHITGGLYYLLMCPDSVALCIAPSVSGGVAGRIALLVVKSIGNGESGTDHFKGNA